MQGTLFFDAISSLPFVIEALFRSGLKKFPGFASFLSFLRIFKLVRLRKIDTTIASLSWSKETKTQVRRVAAVLSLAIVMHVQACIIFMVLDQERFWVAPLDFGNLRTDIWHSGKSNTYIYWKMMYHSALVFAMVDIGPRSIAEITFLIVLIIAAAIITAVIYGLFGSYTEQIKAKENAFLNAFESGNQVMLRLKCKSQLVHKIRDYYKSTFDLKTLQKENQGFRDGLSISLRESIRTELFDATWR